MIAQAIQRRRARTVNDLYPARGPMIAQSIWADLLGDSATSETMTASGVAVDEDRALNFSAFWCGVNLISSTLAALPLITYRRLPGGGKERATDHPNYRLLHDRPHSETGKQTFWESRIGHVLSWGNGYAEVDRTRDGQTVGQLAAIRADRVTPKRIVDKDIGRPIVGYDGRMRKAKPNWLAYEIADRHGEKTLFHHKRIVHIAGFGFDGIQGYSVVRRAKETIGTALAARLHAARFFGHNAMPGGILTLNAPMDRKEKEELKESWEKQFAGPQKSHKVAVLEGDSKFHPLLMSPVEAELLGLQRYDVEEIARWLVLPVHKLRDVTNSKTRSNIEAENRSFVEDTLRPHATRIQDELNFKLFTEEEQKEYFVEFLFDDLLRGATQDRAESHFKALQGAWATVNEIRAIENLNPIEGGDHLFVPLNMATLDDDGKIVIPDNGNDDSEDASDKQVAKAVDERTRKMLDDKTKLVVANTKEIIKSTLPPDEVADARIADSAEVHRRGVDMFVPLLADARHRIAQKEAKGLKQGRKLLESKGEQAFLKWASKFYGDHVSFVTATVLPAFTTAFTYLQTAMDVPYSDETALGFAARYSERYAAAQAAFGARQCRKPDYLASVGDDWKDEIAPAAMSRFLNAATVALYRQVEGAKVQWVAADGCTPACADLHGKTVDPGEMFAKPGVENITYPPLNSVCRCIVVGVEP